MRPKSSQVTSGGVSAEHTRGPFPLEVAASDLSELLVNQRNKFFKSFPIFGFPPHQEFAYGLRRGVHKALRRGTRQTMPSPARQVNSDLVHHHLADT
jgi:hypothetical protein